MSDKQPGTSDKVSRNPTEAYMERLIEQEWEPRQANPDIFDEEGKNFVAYGKLKTPITSVHQRISYVRLRLASVRVLVNYWSTGQPENFGIYGNIVGSMVI